MMKRIALTQQVQTHSSYQNELDALDPAWSNLLLSLGFLPVILPNLDGETKIKKLLKDLAVDGFILTGGNDLAQTKGSNIAIHRDNFEQTIINHALQHEIPVLGVCRGMQLLNCYFGGDLIKTPHHVVESQTVRLSDGSLRWVNSYHHWGLNQEVLAAEMQVMAVSEDKTIKCIRHIKHPMMGIMWHPERDHKDKKFSFNLIKDMFK